MSRNITRVLALVSLAGLAACGGGGGGGGGAMPPAAKPAPAFVPAQPAQSATATVVVTVGGAAPSGVRRAAYISPGTRSMSVTVAPANAAATTSTVDCTTSCSATLTAPVGTITLTATLYDGGGGGGNLLSTGSSTVQIVGGQTNTVPIVFGGKVGSIAIAVDTTKLANATPASVPVGLTFKDGSGNVIVGNDPFNVPVVVSLSDASGVLQLATGGTAAATATVTSNATAVALVYNGGTVAASTIGAKAGNATASANLPALSATGAVAISVPVPSPTVAPTATPAPTSAPVAVPSHVATYYYYGGGNLNMSIPGSFMAKVADWVEGDEGSATLMNAYKNAGGAHAIVYSDPMYQPYCSAPFATPGAGACTGPIAKLITDETAWDHDASANRIYRKQGNSGYYQEALNLGSAAAQTAYKQFTQSIVTQAPALDAFFADDSGGVYETGGNAMAGVFYNFSAAAVEVTSDAQFQTQEKAMLASAARPVIINGQDPSTWQPSYGGALLTAPNVIGENHEGCYVNGGSLMTDAATQFQRESNGLLANIGYQRLAICMMTGPATPANRLYGLAAFWLTYDPTYSVAASVAPASDGFATFAEFDIVPRQPLKTATSDVGVLRSSSSGAYVREFGACYQAGTAIGACAAVVNSTASSVAMPALSRSYAVSLVLDDKSSYGGGTAAWTGSVPASIPAGGGVILRQ